ncbi:MAG: phage baseplate assembly protein V [Saprospiraceae bacterium]
MDSVISIMQKVAEQEVGRIYTTELGVVTAVFPHASDGDKDNYQCSLKLKNKKQPDGKDFELRKVPVATQHIGLANIPNVGDLVLVTFVGGDINAPIIIGRLYNDEDKPPANKEKEFLLQHGLKNGGSLKMDKDGVVTIASQKEKSTVTVKDGDITIATANDQVTIKIEDGGITIDTASKPVTIKSMGEIKIGDAATSQIKVGGRMLANAVGDNDDIILSTHTHLGNLGAPCPILIPTEKLNSIQAKGRNTQVG